MTSPQWFRELVRLPVSVPYRSPNNGDKLVRFLDELGGYHGREVHRCQRVRQTVPHLHACARDISELGGENPIFLCFVNQTSEGSSRAEVRVRELVQRRVESAKCAETSVDEQVVVKPRKPKETSGIAQESGYVLRNIRIQRLRPG